MNLSVKCPYKTSFLAKFFEPGYRKKRAQSDKHLEVKALSMHLESL